MRLINGAFNRAIMGRFEMKKAYILISTLLLSGCAGLRPPQIKNVVYIPLKDLGDPKSKESIVCINSWLNLQWGVLDERGNLRVFQENLETANGGVRKVLISPSQKHVAIESWGGEGWTHLYVFKAADLLQWAQTREFTHEFSPLLVLEGYPSYLESDKWHDDAHFRFFSDLDFSLDRSARILEFFDNEAGRKKRLWEVNIETKRIAEIK